MSRPPPGVGGLEEGSAGADVRADLHASAKEVLRFERKLLRTKWAVFYASWAVAVASYFVFPALLERTPLVTLASSTQILVEGGLIVVTTLAAVTISFFLWGLVERSFALRTATYGTMLRVGRKNLLRFAIIIALLIGVIALSTRWVFGALLIVDTILVVFSIFLLRHLGRAFQPIPVEGWVAWASYLTAAGISYVSLIILDLPIIHAWGWSGAILVWLGCAGYARVRGGRDRGRA